MAVTVRGGRAGRKARFRAALALARMTAREWAEQTGVTETHLYAVLKGERQSLKLDSKIDALIARQLGEDAA